MRKAQRRSAGWGAVVLYFRGFLLFSPKMLAVHPPLSAPGMAVLAQWATTAHPGVARAAAERARGAGRPPAAPGVSLAWCRRFPPPVEGSRIELPGKVQQPKIQWLSLPSIIIIKRTVCFRRSSCWRTPERAAGAKQGQRTT